MTAEQSHLRRELIRALQGGDGFDADPYAGSDRANATRIVALLWLLSAVLAITFLPFDPPTEAIGGAGWALAGVIIGGSLVGARRLLRHRPLSFNRLLQLSYLGLAQVAVLVWLGGGAGSAYENLFLLWVGSGTGIHPPRRALAYLAATGLAVSLPLLYHGWTGADGAAVATSYLLLVALGMVVLALMTYVRAQRLRLRSDEERAQQLARADPLTGMGNRRAFDEALGHEIARASRADSTMTVALLDLDNFKALNDRYGHLEGDRLLRLTGEAVERALRAGDRGFRWGGDEFALLLPDTPYQGAEEALARVAAGIMASCAAPDGRALTISWGIAELTAEAKSDELLGQADLALMAHKRERAQVDSVELRDEELRD
jgi:diguanylate cyclase (GGDEF)-like protein